MRRCILYTPRRHRLFDDVLRLVEPTLGISAVVDEQEFLDETVAAQQDFDLVISFLNEILFRGPLLERQNVNFHPAPPEYPGRGGASYALYDGRNVYGATAHRMVRKIDAGEIYLVRSFPILAVDTCETLYARAEYASLELLAEVMSHIKRTGNLPPMRAASWDGAARTRRQFDHWLLLDPSDKEVFVRKVAAARHSRFPGPFVHLHGHLFGLSRPREIPKALRRGDILVKAAPGQD